MYRAFFMIRFIDCVHSHLGPTSPYTPTRLGIRFLFPVMASACAMAQQAPHSKEVDPTRIAINPVIGRFHSDSSELALEQLEAQLMQVQKNLRTLQASVDSQTTPDTSPSETKLTDSKISSWHATALPMYAIEPTPALTSLSVHASNDLLPKSHSTEKGVTKVRSLDPKVTPIFVPSSKDSLTAVVSFANASSHWGPAPRQAPYWLQKVLGASEVIVTGTSKAGGSRTSNEQLAQARATSLRNYLVKQGVPPARIEMRTLLLKSAPFSSSAADFKQVRITWRP